MIETQHQSATNKPITIRRLLLSVFLFGIFCGLTRLASVNGISIAVLPAIVSLAPSVGVLTRRHKISAGAFLCLALGSLLTTSISWDGGFPFVELQMSVVDVHGNALKNVKVSVTRHRGGKPANGYPIAEYVGAPLVTDAGGGITCHQTRSGLQFGGHAWFLFWCIPVGTKAPQYDVHFDHPEEGRMTVSIWHLFESDIKSYGSFPKTTFLLNGRSEEMPIYKQRIVFRRS